MLQILKQLVQVFDKKMPAIPPEYYLKYLKPEVVNVK